MILLDGKKLASESYQKFMKLTFNEKNIHKLIIITINEDAASAVYVKQKINACKLIGIAYEHIMLKDTMSAVEFEDYLNNLLYENLYSIKSPYYKVGFILQLPAPQIYQDIFNTIIPPSSDVDGFGTLNKEALYVTNKTPWNYPATPKGIITLLKYYKIPITGKHVVIIGRSDIVGKPLAQMMLNENATVTVCHSKTENLKQITKTADILVVAMGNPNFITREYIKEGVTIIDVGINRTSNGICGDVNFESVKDKCYAITPVPGGVGPMTVYSLIENLMTYEKLD